MEDNESILNESDGDGDDDGSSDGMIDDEDEEKEEEEKEDESSDDEKEEGRNKRKEAEESQVVDRRGRKKKKKTHVPATCMNCSHVQEENDALEEKNRKNQVILMLIANFLDKAIVEGSVQDKRLSFMGKKATVSPEDYDCWRNLKQPGVILNRFYNWFTIRAKNRLKFPVKKKDRKFKKHKKSKKSEEEKKKEKDKYMSTSVCKKLKELSIIHHPLMATFSKTHWFIEIKITN
jgi:hypothetical protein